MGTSRGRSDDAPYSRHDAAIWYTHRIVAAAEAGDVEALPRIATPFPPRHAVDEVVVASGRVDVMTWRALGNGSYVHNGGFFFATGAAGLAATALFAGAQAVGNSARRSQAAAAATPRWVHDWSAQLSVSTHGFYFENATGLLPWGFADVDAMELVGPGAVSMRGSSTTGPISWILLTDWAELLLVFWALVRHRQHPQYVSGSWVPPGWRDREQRRLSTSQAELPPG
ncbi:hypothetical protein [Cellulomonas cellasea]|uniref:Uncharacterized protein n=1 Tax=Cellulomonas cellasea TaxID=43670 RepID=A0A7W4UGH2_9CELL|nr:hypothetical protein [Cellulomonas cellasea]MBB2923746.1 hypothetical protein [Cellulomonas cellasea]